MVSGDPTLMREVAGMAVPVAGRWRVNPQHTYVGFTVHHLLTVVRGRFRTFGGTIVIADDPLRSSVEVTIEVASVDTGDVKVDEAARSPLLLDAEQFPSMQFTSTAVGVQGGTLSVDGDLTVRGAVVPLRLSTTFHGAVRNPYGGLATMGLSATGALDRRHAGITTEFPVPDAPGVQVVGTHIGVVLEVEAGLLE
jgi:polyisoprenoid-binding protein YceI